jgi:hypothetical protein
LRRQAAGGGQLAQRRAGVGIERLGMGGTMRELQVLGDELDVQQPAARQLQVPPAAGALLPRLALTFAIADSMSLFR